jgi:predicted membrane protein
VLAIIALISVFSGPTYASTEESANKLLFSLLLSMMWFNIFYAYSAIYSISLIVLIAMKEKKVATAIVMVLGCLILPGILPLFYYLTSLRKKL